MATVPKNFVTQREEKYGVSVQSDPKDDAAAEVMWAGETDGNEVTVTKEVAENQSDLLTVYERVDAAAKSAREGDGGEPGDDGEPGPDPEDEG